jgi:hypothetical protein
MLITVGASNPKSSIVWVFRIHHNVYKLLVFPLAAHQVALEQADILR